MNYSPKKILAIGNVATTTAVLAEVPPMEMADALQRHIQCDWGLVDDVQRQENDRAYEKGGHILSVYRTMRGGTFWISTNHSLTERSTTTILLPSE